jgi:TonB family protein
MKSPETLPGGLASAGFCILLWGCQVGEPTFMGGPCPEPPADGRALLPESVGTRVAPRDAQERSGAEPEYIPYDTPPALLNQDDVVDLLNCFYPEQLREDKVGGRVELWLYVGEEGSVASSEVKTSSGHAELDRAAVSVAYYMHFKPATDNGTPGPVWVSQWLTFEAR